MLFALCVATGLLSLLTDYLFLCVAIDLLSLLTGYLQRLWALFGLAYIVLVAVIILIDEQDCPYCGKQLYLYRKGRVFLERPSVLPSRCPHCLMHLDDDRMVPSSARVALIRNWFKKDFDIPLKTGKRLFAALLVIGIVCAVIGTLIEYWEVTVLGISLMVVAAVEDVLFLRCPVCCKWVGVGRISRCPHCEAPLDEEK